jgi:hypothetical protein
VAIADIGQLPPFSKRIMFQKSRTVRKKTFGYASRGLLMLRNSAAGVALRRGSYDPLELPGKMTLVGISKLQSNLCSRLPLQQEAAGFDYAKLVAIHQWGKAKFLLNVRIR